MRTVAFGQSMAGRNLPLADHVKFNERSQFGKECRHLGTGEFTDVAGGFIV